MIRLISFGWLRFEFSDAHFSIWWDPFSLTVLPWRIGQQFRPPWQWESIGGCWRVRLWNVALNWWKGV